MTSPVLEHREYPAKVYTLLGCPRKLGSMGSKWVYNLVINGGFIGVKIH